MTVIRWTTQALAGLQGQLDYLASYSSSAAVQLRRKVESATTTLSTFPHGGRSRGEYRVYAVPSTNLLLIYRVHSQRIEIAGCVDGRENWGKRYLM